MIVVDSSVWIDFFRDVRSPATDLVRTISKPSLLFVGDIVLLEVLRGARDPGHAARIQTVLSRFPGGPLLNQDLAVAAADNYRRLRTLGITISKTTDLIIGSFCIENGHRLLHNDRDFDPMVKHLGLRLA